MSWAKLDDGFFRHPKARAAGKDGRALFLASLTWTAGHLTDGKIASHDLQLIAAEAEVNGKRTAARLVEVGLWDEDDSGWLVHDYLEYNPTAEQSLAIKAKRAEAGRIGGSKPKGSKRQANGEANALAKPKQNGTPSPYPSPLPSDNPQQQQTGVPDRAALIKEAATIVAQRRGTDGKSAALIAGTVRGISTDIIAWSANHKLPATAEAIADEFEPSTSPGPRRRMRDDGRMERHLQGSGWVLEASA